MRKKIFKRIVAAMLGTMLLTSALTGCGNKAGSDKKSETDGEFGWWIYKSDGAGEYYQDYEENQVIQYINAQNWDVEKGGIAKEENGNKLDLSFIVPIAGSEADNFNTMIATGEYPEIMDLTASTESPQAMFNNGVLIEITEYVEKYMPNYLAYIEANPDLKPFTQYKDEEGNSHYYNLVSFIDGVNLPWQGTMYRRDWVVKYAEPTEYVWDWESDYVKENGHPEVTPLSEAVAEGNMTGWKKNTVTEFTSSEGDDPNNDYTDNVIFPSGKTDPYTISDWEWMFEAFAKALEERGWSDTTNAYCYTVSYGGFMQTGDLVSSFGGGGPNWYLKDGEVSFNGDTDNYKAYVECLNTWNDKGWLDKAFETRAGDLFFKINQTGYSQGMVGMWCAGPANLGASLRETCANAEDAKDMYVMGCSLPINDVYGGDAQKFVEPDSLYMQTRVGGKLGFTNKCTEDKNLAALFTFLDWTYTREGALAVYFGLNEEQLASMEYEPDVYEKVGIDTAYSVTEDEEGKLVYHNTLFANDPGAAAVGAGRLMAGVQPVTNEEYSVDGGYDNVVQAAYDIWGVYVNTGQIMDYSSLLTPDESENYSKVNQSVLEYMEQKTPYMIKNGMSSWDDYVKGLERFDVDSVSESFQKYVE